MNNEKMNQIIDEAYKNYAWKTSMDVDGQFIKEEFINKCKTDLEFSERWELKIEERELSLEERVDIFNKKKESGEIIVPEFKSVGDMNAWTNKLLEQFIPTKLITITYNNETIEVYE